MKLQILCVAIWLGLSSSALAGRFGLPEKGLSDLEIYNNLRPYAPVLRSAPFQVESVVPMGNGGREVTLYSTNAMGAKLKEVLEIRNKVINGIETPFIATRYGPNGKTYLSVTRDIKREGDRAFMISGVNIPGETISYRVIESPSQIDVEVVFVNPAKQIRVKNFTFKLVVRENGQRFVMENPERALAQAGVIAPKSLLEEHGLFVVKPNIEISAGKADQSNLPKYSPPRAPGAQ